DDWDELLPDAEFQYNNYVYAATQMSSFFLDTTHHLHMGIEPQAWPFENEAVNEFMDWMKMVQENAKAAVAKTKDNMA
ncbi:hypothetical protein C0993_003943, partial [Termitomyces sp. T159_Od127]